MGARSGDAGFALDGGEAVLEAVAGAVDRDDVAVVEAPVENRWRDFVAEDLSEFRKSTTAKPILQSTDRRAGSTT